jgi:MFS family permease
MSTTTDTGRSGYNRFLLLVAGLGGLLYGIDVGIIAGALPYLQDTFKLPGGASLSAQDISSVVAAVLLGTLLSTLFAGVLADWFGRKSMMTLSGVLFVLSVPIIALAHSYNALFCGRLLQGISGGLIGVVVPLYLAECLGASNRGKGTAIFQWLLTLGIVAATVIALYFSKQVDDVAKLGDPGKLFATEDFAWRSIFWVSLPPGLLFVLGSFFVAESPRWLYRRGRIEGARTALLRSRSEDQAGLELKEMADTIAAEKSKSTSSQVKESLLRRKYLIPFVLACIILACNQATGVNSVISYNTVILIQAGLADKSAHIASTLFTVVNFLVTIVAVALVDRKGRKFLLSIGTGGVILSAICGALLFNQTEKLRVDVGGKLQAMVATNQTLSVGFDKQMAAELLGKPVDQNPQTLVIIYSYGGFSETTPVTRSDIAAKPISISREDCVQTNKVVAFFKNPFANVDLARVAPLKIDAALITPVPNARNGWLMALVLYMYVAFFAVGPGVCVWLALSELMPTRIRSNGMSFALVLNQGVSWIIAAVFLPTVGKYGYSTMFYIFAGCTVVYFITAVFFLPETKGKTLEEIEEHFEGSKAK